ncbi:MAG TPA: hypothetical protein PK657_06960 [Legionella sp.]|nr:hypothetical protein [Legionella sp.]
MSWWTSVTNGFNSVHVKVSETGKWVWGHSTSVIPLVARSITFTANVLFQTLEQGLALRTAIPALFNNEYAKKAVGAMAYTIGHDVAPIMALNYLNNNLQTLQQGHEQDDWLTPYSFFLSGLTLVNYGVRAITWRQGAQVLVRTFIIDTAAPGAFNVNKPSPVTLCEGKQCSTEIRLKGPLIDPVVMAANELLIMVSKLVGGEVLSSLIEIVVSGKFISAWATPERCSAHKNLMQESVLSFGITYWAASRIIDSLLESTVGIPPYLFHRALRHMLMLYFVNLGAHMKIPLVEPKDATFYIDPHRIFEYVMRVYGNILVAGVIKRAPIDFKLPAGAQPFLPLSTFLQGLTRIINSDLEKINNNSKPGFFTRARNTLLPWVAPSALQSKRNFLNDPVMSRYWSGFSQEVIYIMKIVCAVGSYHLAKKAASASDSVTTTTLSWKFDVPPGLIKVALIFSKEEDFWDLAEALKRWFERHNVPKLNLPLGRTGKEIALSGDDVPSNSGSEERAPVKVLSIATLAPKVKQRIPIGFYDKEKRSRVVPIGEFENKDPKSTKEEGYRRIQQQ